LINIYTFLNGKYLLDNLYNNYLISGGLKLGFTISKLLDKGLIELVGPFGLTEGSYSASSTLSKLDTGIITTYALYITLGLISILFILFSPVFSVETLTNDSFLQEKTQGLGDFYSIDLLTESKQLINSYNYSFKIFLIGIFTTYILLSL
jgi:hypothetical protein